MRQSLAGSACREQRCARRKAKRDLHPFLLNAPHSAAEPGNPCAEHASAASWWPHCLPGIAQELKNETGFLLGSEQIPAFTTIAGTPLSVGGSVAFSFDYARRLKGKQTALSFEVPFAAAPSHHEGGSRPGRHQPGYFVRCSVFTSTSAG